MASHHQPRCGAVAPRQRQSEIAGGIDMLFETEASPDGGDQVVRVLLARPVGVARDAGRIHAVVVDPAEQALGKGQIGRDVGWRHGAQASRMAGRSRPCSRAQASASG